MKTFLIAAGVLMTGASVYGVVDYNNRQHTKEFRELYKEQPKQEVAVTLEKDVPVTTPVAKDLKTEKAEIVSAKKEPATTGMKKTTFKKKEVKKKNRTLRLKEFSRAPLKD